MDAWCNYVIFSLGSQIDFVVMHLAFLQPYWAIVPLRAFAWQRTIVSFMVTFLDESLDLIVCFV